MMYYCLANANLLKLTIGWYAIIEIKFFIYTVLQNFSTLIKAFHHKVSTKDGYPPAMISLAISSPRRTAPSM